MLLFRSRYVCFIISKISHFQECFDSPGCCLDILRFFVTVWMGFMLIYDFSIQAMLNLIWSIKVCMLFMYARMTEGTNHKKWVKYLAIYVGIGWVAVEITFFTSCRPFKGYWGMPPPRSPVHDTRALCHGTGDFQPE